MIDWMSICARKKLGKPEWQWCLSEYVEGGFLITGAVPGVISKGPRKGKTKWPPKSRMDRVILTADDRNRAIADYQAETGKCAWCEGSSKTLARWSRDEGATYRPCEKCNGTGLAKGK